MDGGGRADGWWTNNSINGCGWGEYEIRVEGEFWNGVRISIEGVHYIQNRVTENSTQ